jgi:twinkle protein
VITEGELDALSVAQAFNLKWPVVSLLNGASSAVREVKRSIEWLESFEKVILFFDGDDAGKKAVQAVAPLFSPGKVFVAVPPEGFKDANDMLQAGQFAQLCHVVFQASPYRPDGIVSGASLWPMFDDFYYGRSIPNTYRVPFPKLQEYTRGMRGGELWTVGGGTGVGKSSFVAEIAHDMLLNQGAKLGYIALEESQCFTGLRQLSLAMNVPLHLCHRDPQGVLQVSHDSYKEAWDRTLGSGRLFLYDHWGSLQSENLLSKIRYLIRGCDCSMIVLDHVSIVVSGISGGDERRMIDNLMTNLRSMSQETGCGFLIVSHLRRPDGNAHEEGGRVHLSDFRGSGAIAQLSDTIVGLERNQQDESLKFFSQLRVLKNRFSGTTGIVDTIEYTPTSGRLQASAANPDFGFD